MKNLILVTALITLTNTAFGACDLTLKVKKQGAKTAYLNGETISKSMQTKLVNGGCTISKKLMTASEVREFKIASLKKRLAKAQAE